MLRKNFPRLPICGKCDKVFRSLLRCGNLYKWYAANALKPYAYSFKLIMLSLTALYICCNNIVIICCCYRYCKMINCNRRYTQHIIYKSKKSIFAYAALICVLRIQTGRNCKLFVINRWHFKDFVVVKLRNLPWFVWQGTWSSNWFLSVQRVMQRK